MKNSFRVTSACSMLLLGVVFLFSCFFALGAQFYAIDGPSREDGENRASPILIALERYKNDTGSYPEKLDVLVPDYLTNLPRPAWRWPYAYEYEVRNDGNEFVLLFAEGRNLDGDYCGYSSETSEWLCADSTRPY